jgi:UDPglucose 6-dehydrogenase
MNVAVIGTGYVGLVAGSCLAESGNSVVCVDNNSYKIQGLQIGVVPIYEPGLPDMIARNLREKRLTFTVDLCAAVVSSDVVFLTIGTPPAEDGSADLTQLLCAARQIGQALDKPKVIVIKSTVPVGTAEKVRQIIRDETEIDFSMVANPEFLKEGNAVEDFLKPDRVIVGCDNPCAAEIIRELYAPFLRTGNPFMIMDIRTAELTKYAANAALAARITLINELANICEHVGADIEGVRRGIGSDARIGTSFLFPGAGYGGSCFPKDIRALIQTSLEQGHTPSMLQAIDSVNAAQPVRLAKRVSHYFGGNMANRRVAVWGLAFKPRTNDVRESASIKIIERLLCEGASVSAYDPEAMDETRKVLGARIEYAANNYACLENADALLVITEWSAFRNPNFDRMKALMRTPVVFDGRNVYDPQALRQRGFTYHGIGRP